MKNRRIIGGAAIGAVLLIFLASTCKYADPGAVGSPPEDPDDGGTGTVTSTIRVTGVSLDKTDAIGVYEPGDTDVLIAAIEPENATSQAVTWTSSNPEVAMITSEEGSLLCAFECVGEGLATITVSTWDGDKKASYQVVVTALDPDVNYPTGISSLFYYYLLGTVNLAGNYINTIGADRRLVLLPNEECRLGLSYSPTYYVEPIDWYGIPPNNYPIPDDVDRTLIYASSDESVFVCTYNEEDRYTGIRTVGPGTAIWSMTTLSGHSGEIIIVVSNPLTIEMVKINFGSFVMGSDNSDTMSKLNEKPAHTVKMSSFMMSKYPITQEQYEAIMGDNPSNNFKGPKLPVTNVSIIDAMEFCQKLSDYEKKENPFQHRFDANIFYRTDYYYADYEGKKTSERTGYRLPTEAEWEYACRAGYDTVYSIGKGGSINATHANFEDSGEWQPTPVGSYAPNPWGLYDMNGNVSEWVWTGGNEEAGDPLEEYAGDPYPNPPVTVTDPGLTTREFTRWNVSSAPPATSAVIRGGSFVDSVVMLRSAARDTHEAQNADSDFIGFRVVRAVGPGD